MSDRRLNILCLFIGAMAIAFAPIFARLSVKHAGVGPLGAAFWRTFFAFPLFFLWMAFAGNGRPETEEEDAPGSLLPWALLLPGLFFAGDLGTWHWAFEYTSVANATLLANLATILVSIVAWFWLGERFDYRFILGGAIALAGVAVLLLGSAGGEGTGTHALFGDGLALVTALFYAAYLLSIKRLRDRHSVAAIMGWSSLACAVCLLPVTLATEPVFWPQNRAGWWPLIGMGWISHAGGQGLIALALARLPASFSSVSLLVQPVAVAVWGWLILSQALTPTQLAAGTVVLAGIFLAKRGSRLDEEE